MITAFIAWCSVILAGKSLGLALINISLFVSYGLMALMLYWFCKKEELLGETVGFKYLGRFFVSASLNRLAAVFTFYGGIWFLAPIFLTISIYYSLKALWYFYSNRNGILLTVSLRRKLIDAGGHSD